ncbi:hypothetical protein CFHF_14565 [Caulobacter flavus]|uniref:CBM-cenC domain-containing protein n=1 Tax=Caulobacter flavus TaxID=1679497 RepID=A0A2N5CSH8_9CAUL|nr:hypothetical protein [Caulobacter flavus]AYV49012.1 hypothetical protein C1707_23680 [Caulobacter flavus]PLR13400.1 hypothetical protein CFHF_14565 [Caulobacter flavus]
MNKTILGAAVAALALSLSAPVATAADEGIMKYAINKPSTAWNVYGPGQTNAYVKDKAVVGGGGVRVAVATPDPAAAWRVSGSQAVNGKIAKGDVITVAFWARAEAVEGGAPAATVTNVRVQQSAEPWGGIVEGGAVKVDSAEWKIYTVSGRAAMDADKGGAAVSLHLGSSKQTVVLGPLFVLDFGANYDPSQVK